MKTVSLSGSLRESVGKKDAKKNRKLGMVPCVLYGGEKQIHFIVPEKSFKKIIFTPEVFIINIAIGEKTYDAIIQDVQYHPVSDNIVHVDFLEVLDGKPVTVAIPVSFVGNAVGALKGGRLFKKIRRMKVKALAANLPDQIVIDISKLDIGDSIRISDISRDNITFIDNPNAVIVGVYTARTVVEEVAEEGEKAQESAEAEAAASESQKSAE